MPCTNPIDSHPYLHPRIKNFLEINLLLEKLHLEYTSQYRMLLLSVNDECIICIYNWIQIPTLDLEILIIHQTIPIYRPSGKIFLFIYLTTLNYYRKEQLEILFVQALEESSQLELIPIKKTKKKSFLCLGIISRKNVSWK